MISFSEANDFNDPKYLKFRHWEVLDTHVRKFTSTTVSGGGGSVQSNEFGGVSGHVNQVTSTVHFHSDQDIWLRNTETNQEELFNFSDYKIAVRPGYFLVTVDDDLSSVGLERIWVVDTDSVYYCKGDFNYSRITKSIFKKIYYSLLLIAFNVIINLVPFSGFVLAWHNNKSKGSLILMSKSDKLKDLYSNIWFYPFWFLVHAIWGGSKPDFIVVITMFLWVYFWVSKINLAIRLENSMEARARFIDQLLSVYAQSILNHKK